MGIQDKGGITVKHIYSQYMVNRSEVFQIVERETPWNSRILTHDLPSGNPHVYSYVCTG
jgi:hypothetical protein